LALLLYADECVDARIVAGLRRRGFEIMTAADAGLLGAPDERHMAQAIATSRSILTADQDFLRLADKYASDGVRFPGLIFILPSAQVGETVRAVALLAEVLEPSDIANWIEWVP
jgi:hypothetical protein